MAPSPDSVARASETLSGARRLLVVTGRGCREAPHLLSRYLELAGAVHLETSESRGVLSDDHPAHVPAVRAQAMAEADVVLAIGRRLDFQLAYGSAAVFRSAVAFVRAGRSEDELHGNREPEAALRGDVAEVLEALLTVGAVPTRPDLAWRDRLRRSSAERTRRLAADLREPPPTEDGALHPYALLNAVAALLDDETTLIADGGDILSFARVALRRRRWLDPGPLGCLGVEPPLPSPPRSPGRAPA